MTSLKVLTSPWQPVLVDSNIDGAAVDIPDLAAVGVTTPTYIWMIYVWVYIISMEIDTGALLSLTIGSAEPIELRWSPTQLTIAQGSEDIRSTELVRDLGQWVMLSFDNSNDSTYATVWKRGLPQEYAFLGTSYNLEFPVHLKAPVGVGHFKVTYR